MMNTWISSLSEQLFVNKNQLRIAWWSILVFRMFLLKCPQVTYAFKKRLLKIDVCMCLCQIFVTIIVLKMKIYFSNWNWSFIDFFECRCLAIAVLLYFIEKLSLYLAFHNFIDPSDCCSSPACSSPAFHFGLHNDI